MSAITWIIIILIVVSIVVTVTEVGIRFTMLSNEKGKAGGGGEGGGDREGGRPGNVIGGGDGDGSQDGDGQGGGGGGGGGGTLDLRWLREGRNVSLEELRLWARGLDERERAAVCGADIVGKTFAGV